MKFRADKLCEDITASDGYFKRFFPLLALLFLALWPVAYAYAHTDDMSGPDAILVEVAEASVDSNVGTVNNATYGQAGQVITQEPIHTLSATLASDNVITAPATVLPSHVYVLNNREIVTDKTSSQVDELLGTTEEPFSHRWVLRTKLSELRGLFALWI